MKLSTLSEDLIQKLSTAVFVTKIDKALTLCGLNDAAQEMTEISKKQCIGQPFFRLFQDLSISEALFYGTIDTDKPHFQKNILISQLSGRKILVDLTLSKVVSENEPMLLIEAIQAVASPLITIEERELDQHRQTRRLLRELAHEIKNPLGGIRGAAQLLEKELPESLNDYTEIIIREADRLVTTVNNVLGSGRKEQKMSFNIHELLHDVADLVKMDLAQNITLIEDYDPSLPPYWGYKNRLNQVFLNLIQNSLQAINEDSNQQNNRYQIWIKTRIEHSILIGDQFVPVAIRIEFIDDGPGIKNEIRDAMFIPMVSGSKQGSGLGLSIARDVVEEHGGSLKWLEHEFKTIFCIHLPCMNGTDPELKAMKSNEYK